MNKSLKIWLMATFIASEIIWQLSTFLMGWGDADSGTKRGDAEFFFPLFFDEGARKMGSVFSFFYTTFSLINCASIVIFALAILTLIFLRIFKKNAFKRKKDLSDKELETIKKRKEEAGEFAIFSILGAIPIAIFLVLIFFWIE